MARGRPKTVSDKELLDAGRDSPGPGFTASEIAARTEIGVQTTRTRLNALVEREVIRKKQTSGINIYWMPNGQE